MKVLPRPVETPVRMPEVPVTPRAVAPPSVVETESSKAPMVSGGSASTVVQTESSKAPMASGGSAPTVVESGDARSADEGERQRPHRSSRQSRPKRRWRAAVAPPSSSRPGSPKVPVRERR